MSPWRTLSFAFYSLKRGLLFDFGLNSSKDLLSVSVLAKKVKKSNNIKSDQNDQIMDDINSDSNLLDSTNSESKIVKSISSLPTDFTKCLPYCQCDLSKPTWLSTASFSKGDEYCEIDLTMRPSEDSIGWCTFPTGVPILKGTTTAACWLVSGRGFTIQRDGIFQSVEMEDRCKSPFQDNIKNLNSPSLSSDAVQRLMSSSKYNNIDITPVNTHGSRGNCYPKDAYYDSTFEELTQFQYGKYDKSYEFKSFYRNLQKNINSESKSSNLLDLSLFNRYAIPGLLSGQYSREFLLILTKPSVPQSDYIAQRIISESACSQTTTTHSSELLLACTFATGQRVPEKTVRKALTLQSSNINNLTNIDNLNSKETDLILELYKNLGILREVVPKSNYSSHLNEETPLLIATSQLYPIDMLDIYDNELGIETDESEISITQSLNSQSVSSTTRNSIYIWCDFGSRFSFHRKEAWEPSPGTQVFDYDRDNVMHMGLDSLGLVGASSAIRVSIEAMVEEQIKNLMNSENVQSKFRNFRILDTCTGSGVQGIALAAQVKKYAKSIHKRYFKDSELSDSNQEGDGHDLSKLKAFLSSDVDLTLLDINDRAERFTVANMLFNNVSGRFIRGNVFDQLEFPSKSESNQEFEKIANVNVNANGKQGLVEHIPWQHSDNSDIDFITANTPFWPGETNLLFQSGGPNGERLTAQVVSDGAWRLRPNGGLLSIVTPVFNVNDIFRRFDRWIDLGIAKRRNITKSNVKSKFFRLSHIDNSSSESDSYLLLDSDADFNDIDIDPRTLTTIGPDFMKGFNTSTDFSYLVVHSQIVGGRSLGHWYKQKDENQKEAGLRIRRSGVSDGAIQGFLFLKRCKKVTKFADPDEDNDDDKLDSNVDEPDHTCGRRTKIHQNRTWGVMSDCQYNVASAWNTCLPSSKLGKKSATEKKLLLTVLSRWIRGEKDIVPHDLLYEKYGIDAMNTFQLTEDRWVNGYKHNGFKLESTDSDRVKDRINVDTGCENDDCTNLDSASSIDDLGRLSAGAGYIR